MTGANKKKKKRGRVIFVCIYRYVYIFVIFVYIVKLYCEKEIKKCYILYIINPLVRLVIKKRGERKRKEVSCAQKKEENRLCI